ncbi:anoctamin-10 [Geosmithia morbida]|uniref:Anoctamin-10 n=1 Tax=Geosmithia morbida TaxID=1094350 RepID=A0A9P4Z0T8_9HYPO|nr:anoctamin-10 [Geosmithia morbida]KAF4126623.1 anoctamin-10 [Geosmithia morbida]
MAATQGRRNDGAVEGNFGIDYVLHYKIPAREHADAEAAFVQLMTDLHQVGLDTQVRNGPDSSLFVFIKLASEDVLAQNVYHARVQDWLQGIRSSLPDKDVGATLGDEPITEAERSRLVYLMLSRPPSEGGAGILPRSGRWRYVDSLFPLHNNEFNKAWLKKWSTKYLLDQDDLDEIRDKFGETVAFYFAFVRSYFLLLLFPAGLGLTAWLFLGQFSVAYAMLSCLWCVFFFEFWKKKEVDLAVLWGVRNVSNISHPRPEFEWDREAEDPVTGEPVKVYSHLKRLRVQLLQIPFALICIGLLGGLVIACNSLEVFINEVYSGGGKAILALIPTIIISTATPALSALLMRGAEVLTEMENYPTVDGHRAALIQKQFVLNFITFYMPLLFTAFVYIPFSHVLKPFLEFWSKTAQAVTFSEKPLPTKQLRMDPGRISRQMFGLTVTGQVVNLGMEVVLPWVTRKASAKAKELQTKEDPAARDHPEETDLMQRVRHECGLDIYDVSVDYREMVIQFGYLSMFSVAWPLASVCFIVNNWVELRSDALKIAVGSRRPIPWRCDSIGPWLTALGFLSWLGSITSSAIVFLCSRPPDGELSTASKITLAGFLTSVLFAEHFYFAVQMTVDYVMSKMESPGLQKERRERFHLKRQLLGEGQLQTVRRTAPSSAPRTASVGAATGADASGITRQSLEDEAREQSLKGHGTDEELFWLRQRSTDESITIGRQIIQELVQEETGSPEKAAPEPSPKAE